MFAAYLLALLLGLARATSYNAGSGGGGKPRPFLALPLKRRAVTADVQAHHRAHAARRRLHERPFDDLPLFPGTGTHYAELYVGTPPQRASVIVDTGSHLTAFPCAKCTTCGTHTDPSFDPEKSSTVKKMQCGDRECKRSPRYCSTFPQYGKACSIRMSYQEGSSWSAVVLQDKVFLGTQNSAEAPEHARFSLFYHFGCQMHQTGMFTSQTSNGIMGFADTDDTLVPMMKRAGALPKQLFTMCFTLQHGVLVLGGIDTRLHRGPIVWTPRQSVDNKRRNFEALLLGMKIGGHDVGIGGPRRAIFDSGTTHCYLPSSWARNYRNAFKAATGQTYHAESPYHLDAAGLDKLPSVELTFAHPDGGGKVARFLIKGKNLMEKVHKYGCSKGDCWEPRIFLTDPARGPATFGANMMADHDVIFDTENNRLGWAEADCKVPPESQAVPPAGASVVPTRPNQR
eukprot:g3228.t1